MIWRIKRIDELTLPQQDLLFHKIMGKERVHGGDCGIALYLWGGFTVDDKKLGDHLISEMQIPD